jgi:glucose-6-phosphate-specific signal transduction histidine kinase
MEEIVMGTWVTNKARQISKFAPSGPVSGTFSLLAGLGAGAPVGAAVATAGFLSKHLGEYLTDRQLKQLEQLMRSESPIGKPIARAIAPEIGQQSAVPVAAATRSVLTSPLAPGGP